MVVGIMIIIATALVAVAEWPNGIGRDLIAIFGLNMPRSLR